MVNGLGSVTVPVKVGLENIVALLSFVTLPRPTSEAVRERAVLYSDAANAVTVLSALILKNRTALGLGSVNILLPTVVAPRLVLPVAATRLVAPPSHCLLSV